MTITNLSETQILSEKAVLDNIDSSRNVAFRKSGLTWSMRVASQQAWQAVHKNDNYAERKK